jgi:hypothetical protein
MRTFADVEAWIAGAGAAFGDPSVAVCQLFFRWTDNLALRERNTLACGMSEGELELVFGPAALSLPIKSGPPEGTEEEVVTYGADLIVPGVWAITPSLNVPGFIHAFVVLYGVPEAAPWDRRIVEPSADARLRRGELYRG